MLPSQISNSVSPSVCVRGGGGGGGGVGDLPTTNQKIGLFWPKNVDSVIFMQFLAILNDLWKRWKCK